MRYIQSSIVSRHRSMLISAFKADGNGRSARHWSAADSKRFFLHRMCVCVCCRKRRVFVPSTVRGDFTASSSSCVCVCVIFSLPSWSNCFFWFSTEATVQSQNEGRRQGKHPFFERREKGGLQCVCNCLLSPPLLFLNVPARDRLSWQMIQSWNQSISSFTMDIHRIQRHANCPPLPHVKCICC